MKNRNHISKVFFLTIALYFCGLIYFPIESVLQFVLFPCSGALAIFFLYVARTEVEHFLPFLFYWINGLLLCLTFWNTTAAQILSYIHILHIVIYFGITYAKKELHPEGRFRNYFFDFLLCSKESVFFFTFFGLINFLISQYSPEQWMMDGATSFLLQIGFIIIFFYVCRFFKKEKNDDE